ncbi:putative FAD-dependent oxidoreductase [Actinoplanes missouriensis 431]|uniref:Putative FAD-dependent oxidoreductase n=1 Tax=Actinoplanes missouriensis (strain ATCC 14538 / DSM 43046 / CBS 188.64 / JCM 3121 / NBRC 102363 / NCIMB 12654 / NRRL B-3342 / UNCC 431) TaxID=512565 RepID=I0H3P7_ACTM4|nr:FAD-binding oxidoreductase [Actinoplanes missouriensis]BAL87634.1 putative FAD-dependent oxidoreductase [Actinoplanes missouriensis 431]
MSASPPPSSASVVIIGGGVMGLSTAYHLARAGVRDVVVLDRDAFGSGSTCKAAGGVRAQFSDPVNIALGARSLETFADFPNRFGQEIDFQRVGYLFLLDDPDDVRAFEANVALQNDLGIPSRMITAAEAHSLSPLISTEGLIAAVYSPTDGHCTPESVVLGYATAARRFGATLIPHCAVTGLEIKDDHTFTVRSEGGSISAPAVVCTAGPWSARIGAWAGVNLPVTPLRRQILTTAPMPGLDPLTPFTIDFGSTFYFHGEGRGLLLGMSDPDETPGFKLDRDDAWLPRLGAAIERRAPELAGVGIASGWAGLYENTPDHNALIGREGNFLYATGFSGHGFLMGPAVGEVMRDLYLRRTPFVDIGGLSADRFVAAGARPELNIV